jgi:hypothetical protein
MAIENNGGKTSYYDIPVLDRSELRSLLLNKISDKGEIETLIDKILELCPKTLNDLIEFKNLKPWQHEVMKAAYALEERSKKGNATPEREHNKIHYYNERGRKINKTFLSARDYD